MDGRLMLAFVYLMMTMITNVISYLPESRMTTPELIKHWGYTGETHHVETSDGYILALHRIPFGKSDDDVTDANQTRPVVFLQHGLLDSSAAWVLNLPHQSLGFILADAGYDVWLGNIRGNRYSKKHKKYHNKSWKFWDFCFDEISKYDLPSMIDYVLDKTNQKALYYIGYSQGSLMTFIGLSENKNLQEKIKINFALAPISRMRHLKIPLKPIAKTSYFFIKSLRDWLGFYELFPSTKARSYFERMLCSNIPKLCQSFVLPRISKNLNKTRIPVYFSHLPAGTSVKNFMHFMQLVGYGSLQKFNYFSYNKQRYGSKVPPKYDITKVNVPTVIAQGMHDWLSTPKDVDWTVKNLPNVIERIKLHDYNHLDFLWRLSANKDLYNKIIKIIETERKERKAFLT